MSDWFIFSEYFAHWFNFIMAMFFYYFSKQDTKMIAISKGVNTCEAVNVCEDNTKKQMVPVLK